MAGVLSRFSFATAAEKQLKQRKHCKKHCFLVVGLEKVVFREGYCQGNRELRADPACSSDLTPKLKTNMVKPRKRRFHFIESDSDTDWTIPWTVEPDFELFCALKMWRYHCISLFWSYAVVLTECTVWINYFCTWCALCLCLIMISHLVIFHLYHMIFLVQFGINKQLLIFSKITPTGSCNFVSF